MSDETQKRGDRVRHKRKEWDTHKGEESETRGIERDTWVREWKTRGKRVRYIIRKRVGHYGEESGQDGEESGKRGRRERETRRKRIGHKGKRVGHWGKREKSGKRVGH